MSLWLLFHYFVRGGRYAVGIGIFALVLRKNNAAHHVLSRFGDESYRTEEEAATTVQLKLAWYAP